MELGFAPSSEDHPPNEQVRQAALAERTGFTFALISDHFHPWTDAQGERPFVWAALGGIAQATESIRVGTGVTCPTIRIHPAVIAQAAATVAAMMPGRFFLGVGSGENLNEHVTGARWPLPDERLELLEEAVEVIRLLWQGGEQTRRGKHYTVDHARIYTLPDDPPELYVAGSAPIASELAGRIGDGFISTAPEAGYVQAFERAGGRGKPRLGMMHCAYDADASAGIARATKLWPNLALKGRLRWSTSRTSPRRRPPVPIPRRTSSRSGRTPTRGSRTSTSTRSATTRTRSASSPRGSCCELGGTPGSPRSPSSFAARGSRT
jgi:G6PDH family F420-dependent oxidoreductase